MGSQHPVVICLAFATRYWQTIPDASICNTIAKQYVHRPVANGREIKNPSDRLSERSFIFRDVFPSVCLLIRIDVMIFTVNPSIR
jgi:hypothetical protein